MKEEPPVNFIEPKYRFRIAQLTDRGEAVKSRAIEAQKSYRLKLVSCDNVQPNKEKSISHSALSLRKIVNHTDLKDKLTALRDDIKRIETEFEEEHQKKKKISNIKVTNAIASEVEIIPQQRLLLKPVWERQHVTGKITKKRLKKIQTSRIYNYQQKIQPRHYFPIVERYNQLKRQYMHAPHSSQQDNYSVLNNRVHLTIISKYRNVKNNKKLRRVFNAILFTIYLKRYNHRMREQRKRYFTTSLQPQVASELLQLKKLIISSSQPFFDVLFASDISSGLLKSNDEKSLRQKTRTIKRLVSLEIECLRQFVRQIVTMGNYVKMLYYICKHGNYSCLNNLNSHEQLSLTCISQTHGYMSGDRYLEQSALLSLIFLKLLLYNVFLSPQTLPYPSLTPLQCKFIQLSGNILYQLFIDVQDELLQASSAVYVIGNWKKLSHKFLFKPAQSMAVGGVHRGGKEVIDGLADHKYIRSIYGTNDMNQNKAVVKQCLQELQQMIAKFHYQVREKCF